MSQFYRCLPSERSSGFPSMHKCAQATPTISTEPNQKENECAFQKSWWLQGRDVVDHFSYEKPVLQKAGLVEPDPDLTRAADQNCKSPRRHCRPVSPSDEQPTNAHAVINRPVRNKVYSPGKYVIFILLVASWSKSAQVVILFWEWVSFFFLDSAKLPVFLKLWNPCVTVVESERPVVYTRSDPWVFSHIVWGRSQVPSRVTRGGGGEGVSRTRLQRDCHARTQTFWKIDVGNSPFVTFQQ